MGCLVVFIAFMLYFLSNIIPKKTNYNFEKILLDKSFITNYEIENKNGRIAIYFDTKSDIFKQYNYHS